MPNIRRGSIIVPTAAPQVPHPWKVEWSRGNSFSCFVGMIYDPNGISYSGEWTPSRFPEGVAMQMNVNTNGMSQRAYNRDRTNMNSRAFSTGVRTGSLNVYYKEGFGRCTLIQTHSMSDTDGRVRWLEDDILTSGGSDIYLILHNLGDSSGAVWTLSWVAEASLTDSDIRVAVIKRRASGSVKGWQLFQLWKSDLYGIASQQSFPFQIKCVGREISVVTGSVNNIVCVFTAGEFEADDWRVYLRVSGWTTLNPSAASVMVMNTTVASDDTYGYLLLGTVKIEEHGTAPNKTYTSKVTQLASGSQWVDRFKCSTNTVANYYWNRI